MLISLLREHLPEFKQIALRMVKYTFVNVRLFNFSQIDHSLRIITTNSVETSRVNAMVSTERSKVDSSSNVKDVVVTMVFSSM